MTDSPQPIDDGAHRTLMLPAAKEVELAVSAAHYNCDTIMIRQGSKVVELNTQQARLLAAKLIEFADLVDARALVRERRLQARINAILKTQPAAKQRSAARRGRRPKPDYLRALKRVPDGK